MSVCPHCLQPVGEVRHGVILPPLKARIFDHIKRFRGQSSADIALAIFERNDQPAVRNVRVHICQINEMFAHTDIRISGASKYGYEILGLKSARAA